jgi:aspartate racemase
VNNNSKHIGLPLLGKQASQFYLETLDALWTNSTACPVVTLDVEFERINANLPDKYAALKPLLGCMVEDLEDSGSTIYLVPNITLHAALDRLELSEDTRARIVHPIEAGLDALEAGGIKHITLAGTRHTMQSNQLADYFTARKIKVDFPSSQDIQALDKIRLNVFANGFSVKEKEKMDSVLSKNTCVVLACTELSLLNTDRQFIDLARLHVESALRLLQSVT